ncbi:MAG: hypothetical protein IKD74_07845 [Clostridia bacterium]|nr:hypothetical protein [Clostridia bacterium]
MELFTRKRLFNDGQIIAYSNMLSRKSRIVVNDASIFLDDEQSSIRVAYTRRSGLDSVFVGSLLLGLCKPQSGKLVITHKSDFSEFQATVHPAQRIDWLHDDLIMFTSYPQMGKVSHEYLVLVVD